MSDNITVEEDFDTIYELIDTDHAFVQTNILYANRFAKLFNSRGFQFKGMDINIHEMEIKSNLAPCFMLITFLAGIFRFDAASFKGNFLFVIFFMTGAAFFTLQAFHFSDAFTTAFITFPL